MKITSKKENNLSMNIVLYLATAKGLNLLYKIPVVLFWILSGSLKRLFGLS